MCEDVCEDGCIRGGDFIYDGGRGGRCGGVVSKTRGGG